MNRKLIGLIVMSITAVLCVFCFCACSQASFDPSTMPTTSPSEIKTTGNGDLTNDDIEFSVPSEIKVNIIDKPNTSIAHKHVTEHHSAENATCTDDGHIEYWQCVECNKIFSDAEFLNEAGDITIPSIGHEYVTTSVSPSCTANGYDEHVCIYCGDSYKDNYIDPIGHKWNSGAVKVAPSCEDVGVKEYTCTDCGATKEEIISATGHDYRSTLVDPTCTDKGFTEHVCVNCGDKYCDSETDIADHRYDSGVVTVEPSCAESGIITFTCVVCKHEKKETIEASGHSYNIRIVDPTCTESGYTVYTCFKCGDSYTDNEVDALGHDYSEKVIAASCIEGGYTQHTCFRCGDSYRDCETEMLTHETGEICYTCGFGGCELEYELTDDGTAYKVVGTVTKNPKTVVVPNTYMGKPIVEIASGAFSSQTTTKIYISDSVALISANAINTTNVQLKLYFESESSWSYSKYSDAEFTTAVSSLTISVYKNTYYWRRLQNG